MSDKLRQVAELSAMLAGNVAALEHLILGTPVREVQDRLTGGVRGNRGNVKVQPSDVQHILWNCGEALQKLSGLNQGSEAER